MTINGNATIGGSLTINDDLEITSGTITADDAVIAISGNLTFADGITISLDDSSWHIEGDFTATGTSEARLDLRSDGWTLTVDGSGQASWVRISNSNAGNGSAIYANNSLDDGNNTNWIFLPYAHYVAASISHGSRANATVSAEPRARATITLS